MEFDFPPKKGTGIAMLMTQYSDALTDVITKLLTYNHNHRLSASQALKHSYFKDLRESDRAHPTLPPEVISTAAPTPSQMSKVFRMTTKPHESMSVNSKSMSKISDNASDGSF